ncbi:MarR family winged helix-turn-helix transcriptional regulator [Micromonosporaceae bacterium Da 78-11]
MTAESVWGRMRTLVLDRYDVKAAACAALGMSFVRIKALQQIAAAPMTMRDLAGRLASDPPYVTLIVDDLSRCGLVTRSPNPADRRSRIVTATPAGREAAERAERILGEPPAALRALADTDLADLDRILTRLASDAG